MSYASIQKHWLVNNAAASGAAPGLDLSTSGGIFGYFASARPCQLLGFGTVCTLAGVTKTANPIVRLQKAPYAAGAMTFADIASFTMTLGLNAATPGGLDLGATSEVSALMKYVDAKTGKAPVAPNGYVDPVDLAAGDVLLGIVNTVSNYSTNPKVIMYVLIAPYGTV